MTNLQKVELTFILHASTDISGAPVTAELDTVRLVNGDWLALRRPESHLTGVYGVNECARKAVLCEQIVVRELFVDVSAH